MLLTIFVICAILIIALVVVLVIVGGKKGSSTASKNIDRNTPQEARDKFQSKGMNLIYSNEMKDFDRFSDEWLIADEPLGTLGISDNFSYTPDNVKIGKNGLELQMKLNKNWANCFNPNKTFNPDNTLLGKAVTSGKVTGVKGVRFKYGIIEAKIKCPRIQGIWPAFWLNFSSGTIGPKYPNNDPTTNPVGIEWKSVLPNYPFLNSNFWPPEIDILEITSDNKNTWQNQSSVHTPNQYDGNGQYYSGDAPRRWCPSGVYESINKDGSFVFNQIGSGYCFGVSKFARFETPNGDVSHSYEWHTYRAEWYPSRVDFYLDDKFYGSITDRDLIPTYSGAMRAVVIPDVPMFPIINLAAAQGWSQGSKGLNDPDNFKNGQFQDYNSFINSPMEIAYVRIYQDQDGTGLNPDIDDSSLNIIKNQTFGLEYLPYYNINNVVDAFSKATSDEKTAVLDKIFNELNNYLQANHKDNYCLTVDAATLWNYGGSSFDEGLAGLQYIPAQIQRIKRLNSIIVYILTRYGVGITVSNDGTIRYDMTNLKLPKAILDSPYWNYYGWPPRKLNPDAPCDGVKTAWGDRMDSLHCV